MTNLTGITNLINCCKYKAGTTKEQLVVNIPNKEYKSLITNREPFNLYGYKVDTVEQLPSDNKNIITLNYYETK